MTIVRSPAASPAGDAEHRLLAALAGRYAGAEFTARSAAVDLAPALWSAGGVARPDPAAVGRWLWGRKGIKPFVGTNTFTLANRKNRDGVALWRVRPVEPRKPDVSTETSQASPVPRVPVSGKVSSETSEVPTSARPPKPPPLPLVTPWWSIASAPSPAPGGAAERPRGAWWVHDHGPADEVVP